MAKKSRTVTIGTFCEKCLGLPDEIFAQKGEIIAIPKEHLGDLKGDSLRFRENGICESCGRTWGIWELCRLVVASGGW